MEDSKDFFQSKTTWGAIVLLAAPALKAAGFEVDHQAAVDALSMLAGSAIVAWGQLTRKSQITSVAGIPVKPDPNEDK